MSKLISTSEAADLLGVSRHTVLRMFRDGKLAGVQPRTKVLIELGSVERHLERLRKRKERQAALRRAIQPFRRR